MDIAKRGHYAYFVDKRGRVIEKAFAVHKSKVGFESLYEKIHQTMKEAKKTDVTIGIEPTGHYWMNLAYFLEHNGIPLVIARLVKDGRFSYPRLLKDLEAELRIGSTLRSKLTEDLASIKNRIIRWFDRYFPEFTQVFPSFGKMALAALEMTPLLD